MNMQYQSFANFANLYRTPEFITFGIKKMEDEEIVVLALIFIVALCIWVLLYQVWTYLNSKSLVMQSVLDDLIKDGIIILGTALLVTWIMWIKVIPQYSYYEAMGVTRIVLFVRVSVLTLPGVFAIVKYQMVFHFDFINSVDDKKIKMISRAIVFTVALVCNLVTDFENSLEFLYLKELKLDEKYDIRKGKAVVVMSCITVFVVGIVQGRIVYTRWKNPLPANSFENDKEQYDWKVISFLYFIFLIETIICILLFFVQLFALVRMLQMLAFYLLFLLSIILTIHSNKKLYLHVKRQFKLQPFPVDQDSESNPQIDQSQKTN